MHTDLILVTKNVDLADILHLELSSFSKYNIYLQSDFSNKNLKTKSMMTKYKLLYWVKFVLAKNILKVKQIQISTALSLPVACSTLHIAHCTLQTALAQIPAPAPAPVHFILPIEHCTAHVYSACFTFITSQCTHSTVVLAGFEDCDGKMGIDREGI